ncbi:hypothetical protein KI387_021055, partial [Taxus chinensis]
YPNHFVKMKGTKWVEKELGLQKLGSGINNIPLAGPSQTAATKEPISGDINKEQFQFRHHPKK